MKITVISVVVYHTINGVNFYKRLLSNDCIISEMAKPPRKISKFQDFRNYFGRYWVIGIEKSGFPNGFRKPCFFDIFRQIFRTVSLVKHSDTIYGLKKWEKSREKWQHNFWARKIWKIRKNLEKPLANMYSAYGYKKWRHH